ncbi:MULTISPECIES: hypothetical protein [Ralstonia]|uniref:hypothetical protein n=1 Tax=Ralstonia TaxID=48736 RepID=UPI0003855C96|nr:MULTISPECIES: hypothetical protein [Ralstonia]EPX97819.1 hypothetical protein C404_12285 [Ralstonia sp. AU12-08]GAQ31226.1 peptidase S15 [Ralstonia sp. NT80]
MIDRVQAVGARLWVFTTSALISKGHKLRVAVGASNLPQGVLTFYSDATQPSKVVLPVVPASALQ